MHIPITLRDLFFHDPFFHLNWENFDKVKEHVLEVSEKIRKEKHAVPCIVPPVKSKIDDPDLISLPPRAWKLSPVYQTKGLNLFTVFDDEDIIRLIDDDNKFELSLDTHQFLPEEIRIVLQQGKLYISGRHEQESVTGRRTLLKHVTRTFSMPQGVARDNVTCDLSKDGLLLISAATKKNASIDELCVDFM